MKVVELWRNQSVQIVAKTSAFSVGLNGMLVIGAMRLKEQEIWMMFSWGSLQKIRSGQLVLVVVAVLSLMEAVLSWLADARRNFAIVEEQDSQPVIIPVGNQISHSNVLFCIFGCSGVSSGPFQIKRLISFMVSTSTLKQVPQQPTRIQSVFVSWGELASCH